MVVLNRFCYWFSTRFGALIVGIITLVQCSIWFMVSIISLDNLDIVRETLKIFLENLNLQNSFLSHLSRDPHIYLIVLNVLVSLLFVSTIIMVVGAFKCKSALLMPFLIVNLLYIISMTLQHIFLMINYKKKESGGLGALIFYTNIGGLILLYLLYMWFCVLSLYQMLKEVKTYKGDSSKIFETRINQDGYLT